MATENTELMRKAQKAMEGKWILAIGTLLVYVLINAIIQGLTTYFEFAGLLSFVLAGPLALGLHVFSLNIYRGYEAGVENLFEGFQNFLNSFVAYALMMIFVILWALLLIIPGIIAAISYSQTLFIMVDDPNIGPMEAIDKSKAMMDGYKMKYFTLSLRILGLGLLCILTLGIGFFFLMPYAEVLYAAFYSDLKGDVLEEKIELYQ